MIKVVVGMVALGAIAAVGMTVWTGGVLGPDRNGLTLPVASPQDSFTVHDASPSANPEPIPPPGTAPTPSASPAPTGLDAVMQRMRDAQAAKPDTVTVTAPAGSPGVPAPAPAAAPDGTLAGPNPAPSVLAGPNPDPSALAGSPPPPAPPPDTHWANMTSQGARWRFAHDGSGPVLVIDMGAGRVASVHVQPAFEALDTAGMNARIDYIKQTILENFPMASASFVFARNGSISLLH